jgi:serine/threonine protein kinase
MESESSTAGKDDASQSLLDYVISKGPLKERKVRPLVQQLARTLSLLHKHGVVHRSECSPLFPHPTK